MGVWALDPECLWEGCVLVVYPRFSLGKELEEAEDL